jgi:hypothetical protein
VSNESKRGVALRHFLTGRAVFFGGGGEGGVGGMQGKVELAEALDKTGVV